MTTTQQATVPAASTRGTAKAAEPQKVIRIGHGELLRAAQRSLAENSVTFDVPGVGTVRLPAADSLAWLGGLAALAAVGVLEWPVAAAIGFGHVLANQSHMRLLKDFGEALEEA